MKNLFTAFVFSFGLILCLQAQNAGNALHFDGTNDYVSAPLPPVFNNIPTNSFTIEAWVYPQGSSFSRIVFAQQNSFNYVSLGMSASNTVYFYVISSGLTYSVETINTLPVNQWSHLSARWTPGSNTVEVLFNGVLQSGTGGGTSSSGANATLTIGARSDGSTQFFTGMLDEIRIWNSWRSNCQIIENINSTFTGSESGLAVSYNFNQGVGAASNAGIINLPDLTPAGLNGTLQFFGLNGAVSNWQVSTAPINHIGLNPTFEGDVTYEVCYGSNFTFPDGSTQTGITSSVMHQSNLQSVGLCDSIITTTVNITVVDTSVAQVGITLYSGASGADYQWINCEGNIPVPAATGQAFTPVENGSYAVVVTKNGCPDTSSCYVINTLGISDDAHSGISLFPNPTNGNVYLNTESWNGGVEVQVLDLTGKILATNTHSGNVLLPIEMNYPAGMYLVSVNLGDGRQRTFRIIKN